MDGHNLVPSFFLIRLTLTFRLRPLQSFSRASLNPFIPFTLTGSRLTNKEVTDNRIWTLKCSRLGTIRWILGSVVLSDSVPSRGYRLSVAITTVSINVIVTLSWRRRRSPDTNITGQWLSLSALVRWVFTTLL